MLGLAFAFIGALGIARAASELPETGVWISKGCTSVTLSTSVSFPNDTQTQTIEKCLGFCFQDGTNGFPMQFGGVRNGNQCVCGNTVPPGSITLDPSACTLACPGDNSELCGGPNGATQLYTLKPGVAAVPRPVLSFDVWTNAGCWTDKTSARALRTFIPSASTIQVQDGLSACKSRGFTLAGLEFSHEIYCGNALLGGNIRTTDDKCNFVCEGNPSQFCGGSNAISLFQLNGVPFTSGPAFIPQRVGNWTFAICAVDSATARLVPNQANVNGDKMTVELCVNTCQASGFTVAAAQNGQECWCGNTRIPDTVVSGPGLCNLGCSANANQTCGGPLVDQVYYLAF